MSESYPQERSAGANPDSEYQRLLGRLRQDEIQLAADQRQLRQQRVSLDRLKVDLDARQQELDAAVQALQQQRQGFESHKRSGADGLDAQRAALFRREEDLAQRAAQLDQIEREQLARGQQIDSRRQDLLAQERQIQSLATRCAAEQGSLDAQRQALRAEHESAQALTRSLEDRQASLDRRERDLQALTEQRDSHQRDAEDLASQRQHLQRREAELREQEAALSRDRQTLAALRDDLKSREAAIECRQAELVDLQALQDALHRRQEQQSALDARLVEKERQLLDLEAELAQRQQVLARQSTANEPAAPRDPQLVAAGEQITVLSRRLEALQAAASHLPDREQEALAQRDDLAQQCDALQAQVDELMAGKKGKPVIVALSTSPPAASSEDMAALAAHAARTRRRGLRADSTSRTGRQRVGLLVAAAVAVLLGGFAGLMLLQLLPGRYWLEARVAFAKESPLAASSELARAQRDLGGRLAEARVPGMLLPQDRPPVAADIKTAQLFVQVLTVAPDPSQSGLRDLLAKYRSELEGGIQDAARLQQDRELADLVAATEMQIETFTSERRALLAQAEKFQPLGKAHEDAFALAEKTRKELDEANRRNEDVAARLRVLRRTPPGARIELPADRLAAATAGDVPLAEVRSQVTARADELRTLLDSLLTSAAGKCDQMDAQLDKFLEFLTGQQGQMTDQALRDETAGITRQASRLKGVVQRCRKQISDLSGVLGTAKDVAQAASLVAIQAQSEKALESLTLEAADQIRQVNDLLEKIPAGGVDVTRRTVLQQRLRSHFAEVQKTQHEMVETLNTLRPAVNFRLDAALTAVSGLARRLQDRQKTLAEQIQQQDAQSRRLDYDRQLQQAQAESDENGVERDRLMARLTEATQEMLDADPGRTRLIQVRAQIDDLDRKIAAARTAVDVARRKQTTLRAAATQPAVARLDEPQVLHPAANRTTRIAAAVVCGLAMSLLVFGGYMAATAPTTSRRAGTPSPEKSVALHN